MNFIVFTDIILALLHRITSLIIQYFHLVAGAFFARPLNDEFDNNKNEDCVQPILAGILAIKRCYCFNGF